MKRRIPQTYKGQSCRIFTTNLDQAKQLTLVRQLRIGEYLDYESRRQAPARAAEGIRRQARDSVAMPRAPAARFAEEEGHVHDLAPTADSGRNRRRQRLKQNGTKWKPLGDKTLELSKNETVQRARQALSSDAPNHPREGCGPYCRHASMCRRPRLVVTDT